MKKVALILSAVLLLCMLSVSASAITYNGFICDEKQDGSLILTGLEYEIASGDIVVPEDIMGKKITAVGMNVFSYKQFITGVTLPSTVTEIADGAFNMCVGLEQIVIPAGVEKLGTKMFRDCKGLKTAYIYGKDVSIGEDFFLGCDKLEEIYISDGIKSVAESAIAECSALTDIYCQGSAEETVLDGSILEKSGINVHYEYEYEGFPKELPVEDIAEPSDEGAAAEAQPKNPAVIIVAVAVLVLAGGTVLVIRRKKK